MTEQSSTEQQPATGDFHETRNGGTGDSRVDSAVDRLDELDELDKIDFDEHSQVYDDIHAALRDILVEPSDAASAHATSAHATSAHAGPEGAAHAHAHAHAASEDAGRDTGAPQDCAT